MVPESPSPTEGPVPVSSSRNPYVTILRTPGALAFSISGVVARMPMSMVGIGTILMVQALYGGYTLAGQVSAAMLIAYSVCSPLVARFVDRHGQRRVMLPMLGVSSLSLLGLIICAITIAPVWTLFLCAVINGATSGSFGSMVRARWTYVLDNPRHLHTAYSLESAFDELVFVVGPALTAFLATSVSPSSGLVVPLIAVVVGGLWFLSLRATEPPIHRGSDAPRSTPVIRHSGMIVLSIIFVAMGMIFGATDVSTIAFAEEQGRQELAGVVLGAFAAGSGISGIGYGLRHWISPLWKRFAIGMVLLAVGVSMFFWVNSLWMLATVMVVTGFAIAPTLINGNALVQNLVAPHQLTEGLAWVGTSLGVGVSIGSWTAGVQIDQQGSHGGFQIVVLAATAAAITTLAGLRILRRGHTEPSPEVE